VQDQKYSAAYKSGSPLTTQLSIGTFTHAAETWFRKEYWSGAAPGQIRIDHNLPYMISTMALPNYDLANSQAIPDSDYAAFIGGDKGNVTPGGSMGHGIALQDQGGNNEGAPLQREELLYLYNMGTCGNANSRCAKAWYILTGLRGAIDTTLAASVAGGAGMWNVAPTNTYFRDNGSSRGGGGCANFYCSSYDDKNALDSAPASGGSGSVIGHPVSIMHQPTDVLQGHTLVNDTVVGDWSMAGWGMENSCAHWAYDYSFTAYLLTGEPWYITPVQEAGATCLVDYHNSGTGNHQSTVWFGFANMDGLNVVRAFAWSMQAVDRAAFVTPDSDTAYQNYFLAMLKSNYEILEGFFNITGTALTPTSPPPNTSCAGYNAAAATRWDWGHCTLGLNTNPGVSAGFTPGTGAGVPQPRVVTAMNTANPIVVTTDSDPTAGGVGNGGGFTIYGAPAGCPNSTYTISAINAITKQVTLSGFNGSGCSYAGGATWSTGHLRDNNTSSYEVPWQNHMATVATALIAEHGRTFTQPVLKQVLKRYVEWALASDANPYWISLYIGPVKSGAGTGSDSTSPYFTTWSGYATGMPTANVLLNVFCSWTATAANCRNADGAAPNTQMPNPPIGNFPNADHAYSLTGRAAASFAQFFNVTSSYAQCPGGTCSPAAAWAVYNHIVPFGLGIGGGNSAMVNDTLNFPSGAYITGFDANIKWALAPRLLAPAGGSSVTGSQSLSGSTRIQ
jgi:hypothetical protein